MAFVTTYKKLFAPLQYKHSTYGLPSGLILITRTHHFRLLWLRQRKWWARLVFDVKSIEKDWEYFEYFEGGA